jgi:hypothetical protein
VPKLKLPQHMSSPKDRKNIVDSVDGKKDVLVKENVTMGIVGGTVKVLGTLSFKAL